MRASFYTTEVHEKIVDKIKAIDLALAQHENLFGRYLVLPSYRTKLIGGFVFRDGGTSYNTARAYDATRTKLIRMRNLLETRLPYYYGKTSLSEGEYDMIYTQTYEPLHTLKYMAALEREEKLLRRRERAAERAKAFRTES